jgi:hypothetical protein
VLPAPLISALKVSHIGIIVDLVQRIGDSGSGRNAEYDRNNDEER